MAYGKGPKLLSQDILSEKLGQIDFELLRFGFWQQQETPELKNDILSNYKLVCITKGSCKVSFYQSEYYLNAGDSIVIAPFVFYTATCIEEEKVEFYDFHFNINNISGQAVFLELFHCTHMAIFPDSLPSRAVPMINLSYNSMVEEKQGNYYHTKLTFQRTVLSLLTSSLGYQKLEDLPHHALGKEKIVAECVKYLKQHMNERVTVDDLCQANHISQSYLYQSFMSITGSSTKEFIITYKLKLVELKLMHSDRSIHELSEDFGFSSVYAFSSQFKKYYGISPLQYRKRNLRKGKKLDIQQ